MDTSAFVAILQDEPERRQFNEAIEAAASRLVSAETFLETSIFTETRFGSEGLRDLDLYFAKAKLEVVPVDLHQANVAHSAYRSYGRGRHPAGPNFGDCFSYALAKTMVQSLLYKGDDFLHTGLTPAIAILR